MKKSKGIDIIHVNQTWEAIKKIKIKAGSAVRHPYKNEEILFKPFAVFSDPQIEHFLEEFVMDKQIALHLGQL